MKKSSKITKTQRLVQTSVVSLLLMSPMAYADSYPIQETYSVNYNETKNLNYSYKYAGEKIKIKVGSGTVLGTPEQGKGTLNVDYQETAPGCIFFRLSTSGLQAQIDGSTVASFNDSATSWCQYQGAQVECQVLSFGFKNDGFIDTLRLTLELSSMDGFAPSVKVDWDESEHVKMTIPAVKVDGVVITPSYTVTETASTTVSFPLATFPEIDAVSSAVDTTYDEVNCPAPS